MKIEIERGAAMQRAAFTGVVRDQTGTALPGVSISVRNEAIDGADAERKAFTDVRGAFTIADLNDGIYRVEVTLAGFKPATIEHLELKGSEVTHARVALRMDTATIVIVGALAPMISSDAGKTTISQDFLNRMPF